MRTLAIIPARGGSKGIPGKNIMEFGGKPLVAWSIEQADSSSLVDDYIVSTNCDDIGDVANRWGSFVTRRPIAISGDKSDVRYTLRHAIETQKTIVPPDIVLMLNPTSPCRQPDDIDNAIRTLIDGNFDSVFSACEVKGFTWQDGKPLNYDPLNRPMRQDLESLALEENGSIYVFRRELFERTGNYLGGRIGTYMMHRLDSFQIDEPGDIEVMEHMLRIRQGEYVA